MPISENQIPNIINTTGFEDIKNQCWKTAKRMGIINEQGLKIIAEDVITQEDFRHMFITIDPEDRFYIIRWVDEFGHYDHFFSKNQLNNTLLNETTVTIHPGFWYTPEELSVTTRNYLVFDKNFFGEAIDIIRRIIIDLFFNEYTILQCKSQLNGLLELIKNSKKQYF